jgi:hypothetical protein
MVAGEHVRAPSPAETIRSLSTEGARDARDSFGWRTSWTVLGWYTVLPWTITPWGTATYSTFARSTGAGSTSVRHRTTSDPLRHETAVRSLCASSAPRLGDLWCQRARVGYRLFTSGRCVGCELRFEGVRWGAEKHREPRDGPGRAQPRGHKVKFQTRHVVCSYLAVGIEGEVNA